MRCYSLFWPPCWSGGAPMRTGSSLTGSSMTWSHCLSYFQTLILPSICFVLRRHLYFHFMGLIFSFSHYILLAHFAPFYYKSECFLWLLFSDLSKATTQQLNLTVEMMRLLSWLVTHRPTVLESSQWDFLLCSMLAWLEVKCLLCFF